MSAVIYRCVRKNPVRKPKTEKAAGTGAKTGEKSAVKVTKARSTKAVKKSEAAADKPKRAVRKKKTEK